jgi:tripeptide aminopeptidase
VANVNTERLLETFFDLVKLPAPSGHEAAVAHYCERVLTDAGCTVTFDDAGKKVGSDTGNLYAVLPGTAPGSLVMTAHMDCVQPCEGIEPRVVDGVIRSDGTTILGGDDKVGVASILEAVRCLSESADPHATVKVIFTIQEETGCLGAKYFNTGSFEKDEPCFVFDDEETPGGITLAAPYHYTFEADFIGKASHAGVAPEKGISAIEAASAAIVELRVQGMLGAVGPYCASNIGTIEGGTATNVVAPSCHVTGECRAIKKTDVDCVQQGMDRIMHEAAERFGAKAEVTWDLEYAGFSLSDDAPAAELFKRAVERVGLTFSTNKSAGGTDANMLVKLGVEPVVVATGMTNFHSVDECLKVEDLNNTARIALALAYEAAR